MDNISGVVTLDFLNDQGIKLGSQLGLIMSYYDQTVVFSPFTIDRNNFTHANHISFIINNKVINVNTSRYSYPFLLRVWELPSMGINPSSELTINVPKKAHNIYNSDNKIDMITDKDTNLWHGTLPPFFAHEINIKYPLGTVTYFNNKVTSIVVGYRENNSILVNVFTLKQIISGLDFNYSGLYYLCKITPDRKNIYIHEDWDQYDNALKKDDIILEIEDCPIDKFMFYEKLGREIYLDTWITLMYMEKENINLKFKILRNGKTEKIIVPRKPLYNVMQIPYYSNDNSKISFELMHMNDERYKNIALELLYNPKKLFI